MNITNVDRDDDGDEHALVMGNREAVLSRLPPLSLIQRAMPVIDKSVYVHVTQMYMSVLKWQNESVGVNRLTWRFVRELWNFSIY